MRIIKLTESDIEKIVKKVLTEQSSENINPKGLKFGDRGPDVKQLQQILMDKRLLKTTSMKPTGYFGNMTKNALDKAMGVKSEPAVLSPKQVTTAQSQKSTKVPGQELSGCPSVGDSPYFRNLPDMMSFWKKQFPNFKTDQEVIAFIDRMINRDAQMFKQTIPAISQQGACEVASVERRPQYDNKNIFIIDSPNKQIFLFSAKNKNGARKLVAQDIMIDGKNKQRNDAVSVANAFKTYGEAFDELKNKLKRVPTDDEVWGFFDKEKTRFLPAGIYQGTSTSSDQNDAGEGQNVLYIKNWLGKPIGQALHGYYKGDNRVPFMVRALSIVKNPNNPKEIENFTKEMKNSGLKMDFSYGCINLTPRFVKYLQQYGPNSFIFNIAEDNRNYLVQNTENYFDKMQNSESCPSPKSLGAMDMSSMA